MKKQVLLMAALATMTATAVNAQTVIGQCPFGYYNIPSEFTIDAQSKFATFESGTVKVYNRSLQVEHQFTLNQSSLHDVDLTSISHFPTGGDYGRVYLTQTLFNNDDKYEYFVINGYENESWRGGSVLSEDGTVIWSWTPAGNHWGGLYLVEWDGDYFIVTSEEIDYDNYETTWYSIDRPTQSISRVDGVMPISVFPSVADRDQTITVELGEGNNATEVQVVNAVGQVVKNIAVQPGQREVQLRASDLGSGMHIVGTRSRKGQGACKIIIK